MIAFDLQSHSLFSDGALPPAEVVQRAAEAGVELLALTDHDTVDGVDEALEAAGPAGIRVVPATELSSVDGDYQDLHILGYGIDHHDEHLRSRLEDFRADREKRAWGMADKLRELGYALDDSILEERAAEGKPIGRPHLAKAATSHPDNAARLKDEGLEDITPFLVEYLIEGKKAFLGRTTPTVAEAIELIHHAGGVAVWGHPFWDVKDDDEVIGMIDRFREWGIDGVEVFYTTHTPEQIALLVEACTARDLLMTGSADYHGPSHKLFASFRAFELHGHEPRLGPIANGAG
jgi:predicted metal-dependent phosphoesterase TrpH